MDVPFGGIRSQPSRHVNVASFPGERYKPKGREMESLIGAVGVLAVFVTAFSALDRLAVLWGIDPRLPELKREWWERGW
ncbi:MAG: hypothetical protein ACRDJC_12215 [Thermomicrobiales bacterium]